MSEIKIRIEIAFGRRTALAALALGTLLGSARELSSAETLSMVTYYPSPVGVYRNLTVTGGRLKVADGTQGANKVLVSDSEGRASWGNCTFAP